MLPFVPPTHQTIVKHASKRDRKARFKPRRKPTSTPPVGTRDTSRVRPNIPPVVDTRRQKREKKLNHIFVHSSRLGTARVRPRLKRHVLHKVNSRQTNNTRTSRRANARDVTTKKNSECRNDTMMYCSISSSKTRTNHSNHVPLPTQTHPTALTR